MVAAPAIVRLSSLEMDPLKKDFRNFLWKVWGSLGYGSPNRILYDVAEYIEHGPKKAIIMGWRGVAKSYTAVPYGLYKLNRNRDELVLTLSATGGGANLNANLAFQMIQGFDWLEHLKPQSDQRRSSIAFDVPGKAPSKVESFAALSLFGQVTGRRATVIIPDDVETPDTASTEGARNELEKRYAELGGAVLIDDTLQGEIKVLGTAQTENTLYLNLAQEKGYGMRMWPALYPTPEELPKYGTWLAPIVTTELAKNPHLMGTAVEPIRFSEAVLAAKRLEYGQQEFDRQFRLDLTAGAGDKKPLRLRDIPVVDLPGPTKGLPYAVPSVMHWQPSLERAYKDIQVDALTGDSQVYAPVIPASRDENPWGPPEGIILQVDPSGEGMDEVAYGVLCQNLGRVGLLDMGASLDGFGASTLKDIATMAALWKVHKVRIEKNFGGGMYGALLRPALMDAGHACEIEEVTSTGQKEARIVDTLEAVVTDHRLWIRAEVLRKDFKVEYQRVAAGKQRNYRLTYQLTRITKQRQALAHDDRLDMLAAGVGSFTDVLSRQLAGAANEARDRFILEEGERMLQAAIAAGQPIKGVTLPGRPGEKRMGNFLKGGASKLFGRRG